jgi:hypothetical protein
MEKELAKNRQVEVDAVLRAERKSGREKGAVEVLPGRHLQALAIAEGAAAALGRVELAAERIPDRAGDDLSALARRDRDGPERKARDEVGRAVERIDDPGAPLAAGAPPAPLLPEEAVLRVAVTDPRDDDLLALFVRAGDEVVRTLLGDGVAGELSPVALDQVAAGAGGIGGDLDE